MIGRRSGAMLVPVVAAIALTAAAQEPQDPPVFRSRATAVSLDVSVTRGNRPVTGLTAADFEVTDNGVPQTVEQALTDTLPIDVTLVIDASGSTSTFFGDIRRNTRGILELLRPDDRARVLVVETLSYELLPLQRVDSGIVLPEEPVQGGWSAVYDAILAGLVMRPDPDRRRLLVAITDGLENESITSVQSLEDVARRVDTVLHVISVGTQSNSILSIVTGWITPTRQEMDLFKTLPALTGGVFHGPSYEGGPNVRTVATIRDVIQEFRQSYVIQYTPRNVASGGWHDLVVRVKGVNPRGVRTRAGYFDAAR